MSTSHILIRVTCWTLLAPTVLAQVTTAPTASRPTHSTQDQVVRHYLERFPVALPRVPFVERLELDSRSMAIVARQDDGTLVVEAPAREFAPDAQSEPQVIGWRDVEVEEEEVEVPDPPVPPNDPRPAEGETPGDGPPVSAVPVSLSLRSLAADVVEVELGDRPISRGEVIDVVRLRRALRDGSGTVIVRPGRGVSLGHVLLAAAEARRAGATLAFGGVAGRGSDDDLATIRDLPESLGWKPDESGLHDGEVLLCLAHDEPWSDVAAIMMQLAHLRVWRIAFVGIDENGSRTKVRAPIPIDQGIGR